MDNLNIRKQKAVKITLTHLLPHYTQQLRNYNYLINILLKKKTNNCGNQIDGVNTYFIKLNNNDKNNNNRVNHIQAKMLRIQDTTVARKISKLNRLLKYLYKKLLSMCYTISKKH